MEQRYSLRFETGERHGESIPITGNGITVGRKPGNTLQILDNSVSGKHAELVVDPQGVLLRDLGSTNGTRVGHQRVLEQRLAHGDLVLFGNIKLAFVDARIGGVPAGAAGGHPPSDEVSLEEEPELQAPGRVPPPQAPADLHEPESTRPTAQEGVRRGVMSATMVSTTTPAATSGDALVSVSKDLLAKSKQRSFAGGLIVVALAAIGAGLWFWLNKSDKAAARTTRPVEAVTGNLLAEGYSFETDGDGWLAVEGSPAAFLKSAGSRRSGAFGIEADLEAGQWAMHRSRDVRATAEHTFTARGSLRAKGEVEARLGLEFLAPDIAGSAHTASIFAWGKAVHGGGDYQACEIAAVAPPGYSGVRAVVLARSLGKDAGTGDVAADDISLLEDASPAKPAAELGGAALFTFGAPADTAVLIKLDRALLSGIAFTRPDDVNGWDAGAMSVVAAPPKLQIAPQAATAQVLTLRAEEPLSRVRIATIAKEGYRTHGLDFERANVDGLLFGGGSDLVRVKFSGPATVRGVAEGAASRIVVTASAAPISCEVQLDFDAERKQAGDIAHAARGAEKKGDLGDAIVQWTALLDGYPYEDALVNEAESSRTRLVQQGLANLRDVQAEVERARFFRLADIYRKCRENALQVGARFKGSEVEGEAAKLADLVSAEITGLEVDLNKTERQRMTSILTALEAQKAAGLANEVRTYLASKLGEKK
jgi:hypothetical protein